MKKNYLVLCIVILTSIIFTSCNKENELQKQAPKDFKTTHMKMNFEGKVLEYDVKYSESKDVRIVEGKDAVEVQKIMDKYENSVVLFKNKNEMNFFKDKFDYYYYVFITKNNNKRLSETENYTSIVNPQNTDITFYKNSNQSTPLITNNINTSSTNVLTFTMRLSCNDGTGNSCPYQDLNLIGIKNSWVGSSNNDEFSSIRVKNQYSYANQGGLIFVTLYQDANFGGKAISFSYLKYLSQSNQDDVSNLKDYKINSLLKTWNYRTSSYECFYY